MKSCRLPTLHVIADRLEKLLEHGGPAPDDAEAIEALHGLIHAVTVLREQLVLLLPPTAAPRGWRLN